MNDFTRNGTARLYTGDVAHRAEPVPVQGFVVVCDPSGIYRRGATFQRQEVSQTAWLGCWPDGIIFRDLVDDRCYRVATWRTRGRHRETVTRQRLEALGGDVALEPVSGNGGLKRVTP